MSEESVNSEGSGIENPGSMVVACCGLLGLMACAIFVLIEVISYIFNFNFRFWIFSAPALMIVVSSFIFFMIVAPSQVQVDKESVIAKEPHSEGGVQSSLVGDGPGARFEDDAVAGGVDAINPEKFDRAEAVSRQGLKEWGDDIRYANINTHRFSDEERRRSKRIPVINWQTAEMSAVQFMRENGYRDAQRTVSGADGGIDIISEWAIAQVKHYNREIGVEPIRQLAGVRSKREFRERDAFFFSSGGYRKTAIREALEFNVILFVLDGRDNWIQLY